jgi:hypothetical protein
MSSESSRIERPLNGIGFLADVSGILSALAMGFKFIVALLGLLAILTSVLLLFNNWRKPAGFAVVAAVVTMGIGCLLVGGYLNYNLRPPWEHHVGAVVSPPILSSAPAIPSFNSEPVTGPTLSTSAASSATDTTGASKRYPVLRRAVDSKLYPPSAVTTSDGSRLQVHAGQHITIHQVSGHWNCASQDNETPASGIEGVDISKNASISGDRNDLILPDLPRLCALIAKVTPSRLGDDVGTGWVPAAGTDGFDVTNNGYLYLTVNELSKAACIRHRYYDAAGNWRCFSDNREIDNRPSIIDITVTN